MKITDWLLLLLTKMYVVFFVNIKNYGVKYEWKSTDQFSRTFSMFFIIEILSL